MAPGGSRCSARRRAGRGGDAVATGHVNKAVGDFTARRRSAKTRLGKTSTAKRHALKKRTVFTTRWRTHTSGGATWSVRTECVQCTRALGRGGFETSASSHTSRSLISTCGGIGCRILFFVEHDIRFPFGCFFFLKAFKIFKI